MRLDRSVVTDHDLLQDVSPHDHHPAVETFSLAINSQAIGALSAYQWKSPVLQAGHKVVRLILRGNEAVNIQGHVGVFVVASDVAAACSAIGLKPYGAGGYYTSYMGGYSRLHGDSYLSPDAFGTSVRLRDVFFDTSTNQVVVEFYNTAGSAKTVTAYGSGLVK